MHVNTMKFNLPLLIASFIRPKTLLKLLCERGLAWGRTYAGGASDAFEELRPDWNTRWIVVMRPRHTGHWLLVRCTCVLRDKLHMYVPSSKKGSTCIMRSWA